MRRWQQAKLGEGRVVLVSGEPGIGKSRLTAALSQRIETELLQARAWAASAGGNLPDARQLLEAAADLGQEVGDLIGAGAAQERGVVGETPNLAARLQAIARPGTLVIAGSTRRQLGTLFEIEDLGLQRLAGFTKPQRAWRVVGESGVVSRFEALRS